MYKTPNKVCMYLCITSCICRDANSPTFGGRVTLVCLVSRSPALVHKSPAFYVHYNIVGRVGNFCK